MKWSFRNWVVCVRVWHEALRWENDKHETKSEGVIEMRGENTELQKMVVELSKFVGKLGKTPSVSHNYSIYVTWVTELWRLKYIWKTQSSNVKMGTQTDCDCDCMGDPVTRWPWFAVYWKQCRMHHIFASVLLPLYSDDNESCTSFYPHDRQLAHEIIKLQAIDARPFHWLSLYCWRWPSPVTVLIRKTLCIFGFISGKMTKI